MLEKWFSGKDDLKAPEVFERQNEHGCLIQKHQTFDVSI